MKRFYGILLLLGLVLQAGAQEFSSSDDKKFKAAVEKRKAKDYEKSIKTYDKLLSKYPENIDLLLEMGLIHSEMKLDSLATLYFEDAWILDPKGSHRLTYTLINLYYQQERFSDALDMLQHFYTFDNLRPVQLETAERLESQIKFRIKAKENPKDIELERLSTNINTPMSEYLPSFTADGQTLIYTVRDGQQEDFYLSEYDGENFSPGMPLESLNTQENEGAHCISQDGQFLFFTGCYIRQGIGGCDLYITMKKEGTWIKPINMGEMVNSREWDAQPSLSPDGKRLYFASERKGGFGKADIWYVDFEKGKWSKPVNAGPNINTEGNEASPFIHLDGMTLYFRSDGHLGMGGYDLFISRLDQGEWGVAENMGYPINSPDGEGALSVSTDGSYAYYSSDVGTPDSYDIYRFALPEDLRPLPVSYIKANIYDAKSKEPIIAQLEIFDIINQKTYLTQKTNDDGTILSSIPSNSDYGLHVSSPGYLFYSENIIWSDTSSVTTPQVIDIFLEKIEKDVPSEKVSKAVVLKNIFFKSGSFELLSSSSQEINKLYKILVESPDSKIKILGHTDDVGEEIDNQKLSEDRANAVKDALIEKGIDGKRIFVDGLGEAQPIDSNETEKGRKRNRRTEFILIRG